MTVYGIDLGTTNSAIGYVDAHGSPQVVVGMSGSANVPSVVLFATPGEHLVGEGARRQARADPEHVCSLVKRRMGDTDWRFVAHGKGWSAPAVSALILESLVADARFSMGAEVKHAVITVPAYFGDEERRATMLAGSYAGLNVVGVLSEPIAAAMSYGFGHVDGRTSLSKTADFETVLVYDLGGGTFDATVIELADRRITVLAVEGDHQLGGADWDERLALYLSRRFCAAHPDAEDPLDDSLGAQELVLAAERAKRELSERESTEVTVSHDGRTAVVPVTRAILADLTATLLRRTVDLTRSCLEAAGRRGVGRVDRAFLVGGSSRMPAVAQALRYDLGLSPELHDPELAVVRGAAVYGAKHDLERMVMSDLRTRGRLRDGDSVESAAEADLAAACERVATAIGLPPESVRRSVEIRVDTVVSRGFGVLAVSDQGDRLEATWLVRRNDPLPIKVARSFGTMRTDQDTISIVVVEQQGQSASADPNDAKILMAGQIEGIPPGYSGGSEVRIDFQMGFDGVLHVTAHHVEANLPLVLSAETGATISQAEVAREREQILRSRRRDQ
ncbi:MAG: Hsp70 family protein [Sporichthyaceae bacterium]